MGTEAMKYSLVSREVIADSIETVVGCEGMDGFVTIGGCDKNMPGSMIAIARLNRPAVFAYGGTILPGCLTNVVGQASSLSAPHRQDAGSTTGLETGASEKSGRLVDIVSVFEA